MKDDMTIQEAKQILRDEWEQGTECPCCTQFVKLYPYKITSTKAYGLVQLVKLYEERREPIHVRDMKQPGGREIEASGGAFATLKHWGLIYQPENTDPTKRRSGYWVPTRLGTEFAHRQTTVPKVLHIFNNKPYRQSTEMTDIVECLGTKFDYRELMPPRSSDQGSLL